MRTWEAHLPWGHGTWLWAMHRDPPACTLTPQRLAMRDPVHPVSGPLEPILPGHHMQPPFTTFKGEPSPTPVVPTGHHTEQMAKHKAKQTGRMQPSEPPHRAHSMLWNHPPGANPRHARPLSGGPLCHPACPASTVTSVLPTDNEPLEGQGCIVLPL